GFHWGVMVIDRSRNEARWLDGHLKLSPGRSNPRKLRIGHMFNAGRAAGKILRGYDKIMNHNPGDFDARTLKYVPHDVEDNAFQDDEGSACGPYAFAILRYLFDNPPFLEDLRQTFLQSKWDDHSRKMRFNSWLTRLDMQDLIRKEALKTEALDDLPHKLTARVLKSLSTEDILNLFDWFREFEQKRPAAESIDTFDDGGDDINNDGDAGGGGGGGGGDSGDGNDDDDDAPWKSRPGMEEILLDEINQKPELYSACTSNKQRYQLAWSLHISETLEATKHTPPEATRIPKILAPDNVETLPKDFADERAVPTKSLLDWVHANANLLKRLIINEKSEEVCIRAALQVLSGISFDSETDDRLKEIWIKEPEL
ncbi:hypothetical protein FB567DRAFT_411006, partial [Paraphoma chrysanthemicola]